MFRKSANITTLYLNAQKYWLTKHVFFCIRSDFLIFLDARTGTYLSLSATDSALLEERVHGWPVLGESSSVISENESEALLRELLFKNLLTTDDRKGKVACPVILPRPEMALSLNEPSTPPLIKARHFAEVMYACVTASFFLNAVGFLSLIRRVERLRRGSAGRNKLDLEKAGDMLRTFKYVRPYFMRTADQCLKHSVALLELFALKGLFPRLVIGVQTSPFSGHCWLQHDSVVINDSIERVSEFTPILIV